MTDLSAASAIDTPGHPLAGREIVKMNGAGNAILVLDLRGAGFLPRVEDARALARAPGLAYDQLMVLSDPQAPGQDAFMTIYNQDGSLSASCGNGTRCVAHYLAGLSGAEALQLATSAGPLAVRREGALSYSVDMGPPRLGWREIPLAREVADTGRVELGRFGLPAASCVSMGNPHAIFFVPEIEAFDLAAIGPVLEHDPIFPQRANISLAQVFSREAIRLKVWERGTGLTLACGTAACATLVAAARAGLTGRRAKISLPGGDLAIEWRADDHVVMTGPVEVEFSRILTPDLFAPAPA
ncbi:diaminopimelate epimerase [Rhodoblastus acidophilus]|uniref:Diaminopimelate epimerase n=1 Tax=Candidatus Rhodoblastus alkanivorans TaxID=2954117 RepID=A0ABS9Z2K4_9HYPH|nr:diaminopimelate epimerase [Candidatus Rhodoblastus alkanivorans]MCI4677530.1 diaminopimelate epimerase [Candidatus Rhodoblastus alkanivorans]MCI4681889.1 diaminopimelate epimerase [Candidatus Rhodoblastus alkanivorans]MDI4642939.1 diaminopimelate epimerase [Rhodoblastus acidophilus]